MHVKIKFIHFFKVRPCQMTQFFCAEMPTLLSSDRFNFVVQSVFLSKIGYFFSAVHSLNPNL